MKFYETHFEEYTNENNRACLHPKLNKIYDKFPTSIKDLKNIIFFGPSGTGKYSQMLKVVKKYSPSELKYEKKISITYNKQQFFFKISDIHYEVDMSLLGCNSKLLWHEIYQQIIDIITTKPYKSGIIVCKYFQEIHNELLDNFYSYMQQNNATAVDLKFILITEEISFINDNILNCYEIIKISRPTKTTYLKCVKHKFSNKLQLENITNIKLLHSCNEELMMNHKIICDKIITNLINCNELQFLKYIDITKCVWYILSSLIEKDKIKKEHLSRLLIRTYGFFQYYNNNYRPIYHVENYLFYLVSIIHNF